MPYLAVCPKCEKFFSITDTTKDYYCEHDGKLYTHRKTTKPPKAIGDKIKCKVTKEGI